jgi:hypothetical protein
MGTKGGPGPASDYDGPARNGANVSHVRANGGGPVRSRPVDSRPPLIEPLRELKLSDGEMR